MADAITIIGLAIASGSLLISFFTLKDRRGQKKDDEFTTKIESLKEEVGKINILSSDLRVLKESIEKDLSEKVEKLRLETVKIASIDVNIAVLKERIDNEVRLLDKLEEKLEDLVKEFK
jgi:chromosome segregation ATPase